MILRKTNGKFAKLNIMKGWISVHFRKLKTEVQLGDCYLLALEKKTGKNVYQFLYGLILLGSHEFQAMFGFSNKKVRFNVDGFIL